MRLRIGVILAVATIFLFTRSAFAQFRGDGVGALATHTGGTVTVSVTNGKTAPWAEVGVQNATGTQIVVAEIDSQGIFNFTFTADPSDINNLYINATDSAGISQKVKITGSSLSNELLPPTIINDNPDKLPDTSIRMSGYTYPSSRVDITVTGDNGYNKALSAISDKTTGKWTTLLENLDPGKYTAVATSTNGTLKSQKSQELIFDVLTAVGQAVANTVEAVTSVVAALPEPAKKVADVVSKTAAPVLTTYLAIQIFLTGLNIQDFLLVFLSSLFGRRKKRKWGIIYDTITKAPLEGAIVRLYEEKGKLVETDVTGKMGVFSFLTAPGRYKIAVAKANYTFPSRNVVGERDQEYQFLYYGDVFEVKSGQENINFDIPIDPRNYILPSETKFSFKKLFNTFSEKVLPIITPIGVLLSFVAAIVTPTLFNKVILGFYVATFVFLGISRIKRNVDWGAVVDEKGGVLPAISLSLLEPLFNRQVQRRITDINGRYRFVVPKGRYYIQVSTPGWKMISKGRSYTGEVVDVNEEGEVIKPKIVLGKA